MMVGLQLLALLPISLAATVSAADERCTHGSEPSLCKLAAVPGIDLSEGFGSTEKTVSTTGTLKAAMVFIDFPDAIAHDSPKALYDLFVPAAPHWYSTASYGALELLVDYPREKFYRMPSPSTSYGFERGLSAETHRKYIEDALAAVGKDISFRGVELLYIVPTKAATAISFSTTYHNAVTAADGSSMLKTVTFGQDAEGWGFKVMNHETGHAMGLPDLYPSEGTDTTRWTGGFDLMSLISGVAPDLTAWHKWKLGWLEDMQIGCVASTSPGASQTFTLAPLETAAKGSTSQKKRAVVVVVNETTALVAEARTRKGLDGRSCAPGVLIYAVRTDVGSGEGPIRVFDSKPDSGGCRGDELNDAPYDDAVFTSDDFGVTIAVGPREEEGTWEISITRS